MSNKRFTPICKYFCEHNKPDNPSEDCVIKNNLNTFNVRNGTTALMWNCSKYKEAKGVHLSLSYQDAYYSGDKRHAQVIMKDLGIEYRGVTPQTLGDAMWFWYCTNLPENLPSYITILKATPEQWFRELED